MLFNHLTLRRYVVIELKIGTFDPAYLGQLGMYMAAVDDLKQHTDDLPTIGLLLCKTKSNVVIEYALRGFDAPIGVAEWAESITTSMPAEVASRLPNIEGIEAELADIEDEQLRTRSGCHVPSRMEMITRWSPHVVDSRGVRRT